MHLIIGGAYQGKLDYAISAYRLCDKDIFTCTEEEIDFSRRCICKIEEFTYGCVTRGRDPVAWFQARQDLWENSILILGDICGGIVPTDSQDRAWREATGRLCQYLSRQARQVSRIFCGLEQRLK